MLFSILLGILAAYLTFAGFLGLVNAKSKPDADQVLYFIVSMAHIVAGLVVSYLVKVL